MSDSAYINNENSHQEEFIIDSNFSTNSKTKNNPNRYSDKYDEFISANNKNADIQSPESQRLSFLQNQQSHQLSPLNNSQVMNTSMNISPQAERSIRLTTELESLVKDLDLIYNEIGLSTKEIYQKEADVFRSLSNTIRSFAAKAQEEKQTISTQNSKILECLKTILDRIGDSKGTYTINDLYVRNMIVLSQHDLSPSKRDMSLLSKRRILMQGSEFVFEAFHKILREYLHDCVTYNQLVSVLYQNNVLSNGNLVSTDVLSEDEIKITKENIEDSNKLAKWFFENSFIKDTVPFKLLNNVDLQSYNLEYRNKLNTEDVHQNKIKMAINEMNVEYINKKENLILHIKEISECYRFLNFKSTSELKLLPVLANNKYGEQLVSYIEKLPNLVDKIPVFEEFIQAVDGLLKNITQLKLERMEINDTLLQQVEMLWSKLKIKEEEINEFKSKIQTDFDHSNSYLPQDQLTLLKNEVDRLKSLRKTSIRQIIKEDWKIINDLWDAMKYSKDMRSSFENFYEAKQLEIKNKEETVTDFASLFDDNEYLLNRLDEEIKSLEEQFKNYEPVLKNINLYENLLKEKIELDESSKNPGRLTSRDSHKILLREEKLRKRIQRHFPVVVNALSTQLKEFEENFGKPFMKDTDETYLSIIEKEKETLSQKFPRSRVAMFQNNHEQQVSQKSSSRTGSGTSRFMTSLSSSVPPISPKGIRTRNKKILTNAAKSLPMHSTGFSRIALPPRVNGSRLEKINLRNLEGSRKNSSRVSSQASSTVQQGSRATSAHSLKSDIKSVNIRSLTSLSQNSRGNRSDRASSRVTSSGSYKRSIPASKVDPNDFTLKKVRMSNKDEVINKSATNVLMNESLSPIKATTFIAKTIEQMSNASSPMTVKKKVEDFDFKNISLSDNSINDDIDIVSDMKFSLWQKQQIDGMNEEKKDNHEEAKPGIAIHDMDNL
ncbi:hypothetical protein FOG51_03018 [Hanseniaspora uvarum]|nr:hypothetical protein FOG48_01333 [Hanseniaspora uvarum]KAF0271637.1 hypothetical protein FOG51_03018 [Hanseniaspora uvarum]KAF0277654.1 hypothetical protein FOG50_01460 [Hanseniaspora uvarum]KKA03898.1 Anaphase spindle elongation protein [Hanseniaspora uvarum DSM 2768]